MFKTKRFLNSIFVFLYIILLLGFVKGFFEYEPIVWPRNFHVEMLS